MLLLPLVNSVVFGFMFTIWSRSSTLNVLLKFLFLVLTTVNLLTYFKVI